MQEMTITPILDMIRNPVLKDKGFLLLMDLYKEPIYWNIRRLVVSHHDAEDILQETFINVYRHLDTFKGESKMSTWLYRIATNECIKHFRKNSKRKNSSVITEGIAEGLSVSDSENSEAILLKFQAAILQLPEKQRIVFNLRYYDELSYEVIGQVLNSSADTVKTNFHYASQKVKQYLIDHA
jgi:RNA polymerase sigma-70 factor (ECF subfamily)